MKSTYELNDVAKTGATNIEDTSLYKALKQYRLETSREEGIKGFYVYITPSWRIRSQQGQGR